MRNNDSNEISEAYNEGWEDALQFAEKEYIKLDIVSESIDKFLDKINSLKKINNFFYDHFKNGKNIDGNPLADAKEKKNNIEQILKLIETEIEKDKINNG